MTVNATLPIYQVTAGGQTTFTIPFAFYSNTDIKVRVNGVLRTNPTHYTISGSTVTFGVAPANGSLVEIEGDMPLSRSTHFETEGDFHASAVNLEWDRSTIAVKQTQKNINRKIGIAPGYFTGTVEISKTPDERANKVISFDANGDIVAVNTVASAEIITDLITSISELEGIVGDGLSVGDSATEAEAHKLAAEAAALDAKLSVAQTFPINFEAHSKYWTDGLGQAGSPAVAANNPLQGSFVAVEGEGIVYQTELVPENCNSFGPIGVIEGIPGRKFRVSARIRAITDNTGGTPVQTGVALIHLDSAPDFGYTEFVPGAALGSCTVADGWQVITFEFVVPDQGSELWSPYYRPSIFYNVVGAEADPLEGSNDPQGNQVFQVAYVEIEDIPVPERQPRILDLTTLGAGTYTPYSGALWARVRIRGAGGGGGGGGTNSATNGTAGGDTTFGDWTAHGGARGMAYNTSPGYGAGGNGGSVTAPVGYSETYRWRGGANGGSGPGGYSYSFGGNGGGGAPGVQGGTATRSRFGEGAGGAGGGSGSDGGSGGSNGPGGGGGEGGEAEFILYGETLAVTSFSIGAGGSAGAGGTTGGATGANGQVGEQGSIYIEEHFQ